MKVGVNGPRTPVTKGSNGTCMATIPNVCKMPGPPAPFVPTPLPNIAMSNNSPSGFSNKVKIEKHTVAIKFSTFKSVGDEASMGTGGGIVSSTTKGECKFVAPGSLDTKVEGKSIQLLGDATTNNNGGAPNAATMATLQAPTAPAIVIPALQEAVDEAAAAAAFDDPVKPEDPAVATVVIAALAAGSCAGILVNASNGQIKLGVPYSPSGAAGSPRPAQAARNQAASDHAAATTAGTANAGTYQESFVAAGGMPAVTADAVVTDDAGAPASAGNVDSVHDMQFAGGSGTTSPARRQQTQAAVGKSPSTIHSGPVSA